MQSNTLPGMHVWKNETPNEILHHICTLSERNPRNTDNNFNTSAYDAINNKTHLNELLIQ